MSIRSDESAVVAPPVSTTVADCKDAKTQIQRRMDEARESISETVGDIKETVEGQFATARETIHGILDWRTGFQQDPVVWSVGSLAAGFALGYTLGYAKRKGALGTKQAGLGAFADSLVHELVALRHRLPMATLDPTFKRVLGFDLSQLFDEMSGGTPRSRSKAVAQRKSRTSRAATSRGLVRKKRRAR